MRTPSILQAVFACCLATSATAPPLAGGEPEVSYRNEVMAALAKGGCNQGTCHGNKHGKGGFKLSLRGDDPVGDYAAIVRDQFGRRVDEFSPAASLLLKKATAAVSHGGGRRFEVDSWEYAALHRWIAAGLPNDVADAPMVERLVVHPAKAVVVDPEHAVQLEVSARLSDGKVIAASDRAVYEASDPTVTITRGGRVELYGCGEATVIVRFLDRQVPVHIAVVPSQQRPWPEYALPRNFVDKQIDAKLRELRLTPAPVCDDAAFLRRAYLDLCGILPTAEEAQAFTSSVDADKRANLVDELLERPEFADWWALKWSDLLRNEEQVLDEKGVQHFHAWIRTAISEGMPLDVFAAQIVSARGSTYDEPAANFYRALRDPITRAETAAQVFLGSRLQCAKCHNHPFDRWSQDDYYSWAAVFARIDYKVLDNDRRDDNDSHEFDGEQVVAAKRSGSVRNDRTGRPAEPRFLASDAPLDSADRLEALAEWLTAADNERFAKVQVNRIWFHLMGRGLVDPIDDFRDTNPASHPALLDALAADFVGSGFDLRHVIRTITSSRAYATASRATNSGEEDDRNYSHAIVRRLSAEQLADAFHQVLAAPSDYDGYPVGLRAGELPGVMRRGGGGGRYRGVDPFLKTFGKPSRLLACECERSEAITMSQAFTLISGELLQELLTERDNLIGRRLSEGDEPRDIVRDVYWAALARAPSDEEMEQIESLLAGANDQRAALEDVAWAVLNSKEFLFRR